MNLSMYIYDWVPRAIALFAHNPLCSLLCIDSNPSLVSCHHHFSGLRWENFSHIINLNDMCICRHVYKTYIL